MRRILFSLMMLALLVAPTAGQGAPDAINDALAALSQRLGFTVTLNDVFWTWEQTVFNDNELGCAPAGVTAAPASVVGYIFSFTWDEVVYTYHTAADRTKTVFCGSSADAGTTVELVDAIDVEEAIDLSNRLCPPAPANDKPYIRSRVAAGIEARVTAGDPLNLRQAASTTSSVLAVVPGLAGFTVTDASLPSCDPEGNVWWQVSYNGAVGFVAEGLAGAYFIEPLPPSNGLPQARGLLTPERLTAYSESVKVQGNLTTDAVAWSETGKLAVLGDRGAEGVWVYDVNDLTLQPRRFQTLDRFTQAVFSTASGQEDVLVLGSETGSLHLWDLSPSSRLTQRLRLNGHDSAVTALAIDPTGTRLASSGGLAFATVADDGNRYAVLVWDVQRVSQVFALRGHTERVNEVAFSPDGALLVTASADRTVRLWDMTTGLQTARIDADVGANALAFSPDGSTLAVGYADGSVLGLSLVGGISAGPLLPTHTAAINALSFTPSGDALISLGANGTLAARSTAGLLSSEAAQVISLPEAVGSGLALSPDGTTFAVAFQDRTVRLYSAP